jgi:Tfp pilus assembly protein PilP
MKKFLKITLINAFAVFAFASTTSAQERDPFSPTGNGVINAVKDIVQGEESGAQQDQQISGDPLTSSQLAAYKVAGILVSDDKKVAAIKAINGVTYIVKLGDNLGAEGGKISDINPKGITIQTTNKEVKIPVSNKIEVPVDAKNN